MDDYLNELIQSRIVFLAIKCYHERMLLMTPVPLSDEERNRLGVEEKYRVCEDYEHCPERATQKGAYLNAINYAIDMLTDEIDSRKPVDIKPRAQKLDKKTLDWYEHIYSCLFSYYCHGVLSKLNLHSFNDEFQQALNTAKRLISIKLAEVD